MQSGDRALNRLALETSAVRLLREIADQPREQDDDTEIVPDGASFAAAVGAVAESLGTLSSGLTTITARMSYLQARKARLERRIETLRVALTRALSIAEIATVDCGTLTVSSKRVPPKAIITDESLLPADCFRRPAPEPDKTVIKRLLLSGQNVPGATLSNGGTTVQITIT